MQKTSAILIFMMLTTLLIPASAYNGASGQAAEFQRSWNLELEGTLDSNSLFFRRKKDLFSSFSQKCFYFLGKVSRMITNHIKGEKCPVGNYRTSVLTAGLRRVCASVLSRFSHV